MKRLIEKGLMFGNLIHVASPVLVEEAEVDVAPFLAPRDEAGLLEEFHAVGHGRERFVEGRSDLAPAGLTPAEEFQRPEATLVRESLEERDRPLESAVGPRAPVPCVESEDDEAARAMRAFERRLRREEARRPSE